MPPDGGPGAEPGVDVMLGAVIQVLSAAVQPGQERNRYGEALLGPLVGAVADRPAMVPPVRRWRSRRRSRSSSWRCPALPMSSSLAAAQRWKSGQAPVAGRQHIVADQQQAQVFHGAVRPEASRAAWLQGMRSWARSRKVSRATGLRRSHTAPLCGQCIDTSPSASGRRRAGTCPPGPARASVNRSASTHHQQRPRSPAVTSRPQPHRKRAGMPLQRVQAARRRSGPANNCWPHPSPRPACLTGELVGRICR